MKIDNFFFPPASFNCVPETPDDASKRNEKSYWNIPFWKIIHYGCCFKNVSQPKFYKSQAILNHTFKLTKQSEANFFMIGWMILSIKIILWLNIEMFERRNNRKQVFFLPQHKVFSKEIAKSAKSFELCCFWTFSFKTFVGFILWSNIVQACWTTLFSGFNNRLLETSDTNRVRADTHPVCAIMVGSSKLSIWENFIFKRFCVASTSVTKPSSRVQD